MDHHCVFTDNCIGKKNLKYFFHFVGWAEVTLCTGIGFVLFNIYVRNPEHNYGTTGLFHLLEMCP